MPTNHYFQSGIPGGRSSEQYLVEDLIIECLKIYGFDIYYLPRQKVFQDEIFKEDVLNTYTRSYPLEMYLTNVNGFEGEGDLLSKFGVEIRDTANFVVAKRRWDQLVARDGYTILNNRPAEGDLLYMPLTKSLFEIRKVETQNPFFQLGKLYVYNLQCELFQYSSERINTGLNDIDKIEDEKSLDIQDNQLVLENGYRLMLEYDTPSSIILENYDIDSIDPMAQNKDFESEIDILDFSERNPFGEIHNS